MVALTHREMAAARRLLIVGSLVVIVRWTSWAVITDSEWLVRALIGAAFGALLFAGVPALWEWSKERENSQAIQAQTTPSSLPALTAEAEPQPTTDIQPAPLPLSQTNPTLFEILDDSEKNREFTDKTLDYFNDLRKRENPVQIEVLLRPYIGMLVRYDGLLDGLNIVPTEQGWTGVAINFNGNILNGGMILYCRYPDKFKNWIARLNPNQQISGIGTIAKFGPLGLELNGCHPISPRAAILPSQAPPQPPEEN